MSEQVLSFEKKFSKKFNSKYSVMTNSGSSANLLMLSLLKYKYGLTGDIIVPAVGWSTSYFPIHQLGFKINFVDVDLNSLNIDTDKIVKAITKNTAAIMAINLLGNSSNFYKLRKICNKHKILLIEDNCESLGAKSNDGRFCGTIGKVGTFSFFYSHHLQTMEGGMVVCKSKDDYNFLKSLRAHGWCRDIDSSGLYKKTGNKFKDSFTFITPGYCVRPLEMSGAIGIEQLKKWKRLHLIRRSNAKYFFFKLRNNKNILLQEEEGESSWFGFSIILKNKLHGKRDKIIKELDKIGIETRPIVTGNFLRQPVIKFLNYIDNKDYKAANIIHDQGFFVGNNPKNLEKEIDLLAKYLNSFD